MQVQICVVCFLHIWVMSCGWKVSAHFRHKAENEPAERRLTGFHVPLSRPVQWWGGGRGRQRQHRKRQQTGQRFPSTRRLRSLLSGALRRQGGSGSEKRRRGGGGEPGLLWRNGEHEDHDTSASADERSGETWWDVFGARPIPPVASPQITDAFPSFLPQFGNQPPEQFSPRTKKPKIESSLCDSIILECRSVRVGSLRRMVTKPVVVSLSSFYRNVVFSLGIRISWIVSAHHLWFETVQDLKIFRVKIHRGWVSDLVLLNHFSHVLSPLSAEAGIITFSGLEKTHLSFTNCIQVNFHPLRVTV